MTEFLFEVESSNREFSRLKGNREFLESLGVKVAECASLTVLTVPLPAQGFMLGQSTGLDHLYSLQADLCELFGFDRTKKTKLKTDPISFDILISQVRDRKIIAGDFVGDASPKKQEGADTAGPEKEEIRHFPSGAVRGGAGKPDFVEAVSFIAAKRFALYMLENAAKYGPGNWRKGIPILEYERSLLRHVNTYFANKYEQLDFEVKVDHLAAAQFNLQGIMHEEEMLKIKNPLPKR